MDPKKELLNYPPKQRDITHLKKTNILNMEGEEASPVKQKPKENLFKKLQEDELKEQKIRLTATNTSNLFSEK